MRWSEVIAELRARRAVAQAGDGWLAVEWRLGAELQRQRVQLVAHPEGARLVIATEVAPLVELSAVAVLRHDAALLLGALVVEGHRCVLRRALRLDELTVAQLARGLVVCAHQAGKLRGLRRGAA